MSQDPLSATANDVFDRVVLGNASTPPDVLFAPSAVGGDWTSGSDEVRDDPWFAWEDVAPFLARARVGAPVSDRDKALWASYVAWAFGVLMTWTNQDIGLNRSAQVALTLLDLTQMDDPGWSRTPQPIADNEQLRDAAFHALDALAHRVVMIDNWGPSPVGVRAEFPVPEGGEDWARLSEAMARLETCEPAGFRQLARLVSRLWPADLALHVTKWRDPLAATALAEALGAAEAFAVALQSGDPLVGYAAIRTRTSLRAPMSSTAEQSLEALLVATATNNAVWRGWMSVLNPYPVRFPALQVPLGRALAQSSEGAFDAWLNSLELRPVWLEHTAQFDQSDTVACLQAFISAADPAVRERGLKAIWARWTSWNFGERDAMMRACGSEIDLGVIGYATEVLTPGELEKAIDAELASLRKVFAMRWPSSVALISAVNLAISRYQPLAHARALKAGANRLSLPTGLYETGDPNLEWCIKRANVR